MYRKLGFLVLCVTVSACSSSGASDGNNAGGAGATNGGSGGTNGGSGGSSAGGASSGGSHAGGSSGAGASAGSGATSGAVRGAFSVNVQAPSGCTLMAKTEDYPIVASGHPVTGTDQGVGIADKTKDSTGAPASVHCSWFSDTAPYMIDAGITLGTIASNRSVSMNSTLVAGMSSVGGLNFQSQDLPDFNYSATCNFSVIKVDPTTRSVWGSFTCDTIDVSASSTSGMTPTQCTVGTSYFSFENCTKP
jgi:hypothetical protein